MKRVLPFIAFLLFATPASAQHVDVGIDFGRAFSIVDGRFVPSTIPSATVIAGSFEIVTSAYYYGYRFYEQDTTLTWYQRKSSSRRWSVFVSLAHYKWPGGQDINGQAGLRWRIH